MFKKLPVRLFLIKLPAILSLLLTLSCSDFTGSKGPNRATEKPAEKPTQGGKNPFPAGFDPFQQPFSEEKMLATIGTSVLYPASREFRLNLENLQIDIQKLMAELRRSKADPLTLQSVQQSWKKAMLAFHYLDAAPLGPLTNRGRYLIDNIYSWPRFNPCGIDLEVAQLAATGAGNKNLLFTLKGLNALEYLFFSDSSGSYCNRNNQSHKAAFDWLTKSDIQRRADRAAYAEWIMPELVRMARELEQGWDPNEGNFSNSMIDNSVYPSVKEATNALSDAMFSIEEIKDRKLGRPLGAHKDCASSKCPEDAEHEWSGIALEGIVAQLQGLKAVYLGQRKSATGQNFGFDDFLISSGRADVASTMEASLTTAIQKAQDVAALGTLQAQIGLMDPAHCKLTTPPDQLPPICAFHQEIRQTVIRMKTELLTALSLRAPAKHQGDND